MPHMNRTLPQKSMISLHFLFSIAHSMYLLRGAGFLLKRAGFLLKSAGETQQAILD